MAISESTRCTETSGKSDPSKMPSTSSQTYASFPDKTQAPDGPTTLDEPINDSSAAAKLNFSATFDVNPARNAASTEDIRSPIAATTADKIDHAVNFSFTAQVLATSYAHLTGDSFSWSGQAPEDVAPQSGPNNGANIAVALNVSATAGISPPSDSFSWSGQAPEDIAPQSGPNNGVNIAVALSVSATAGVSPPSDSFSWSGQAIDSAVHPGRSNNGANVSVTLNASATAGAYSLSSNPSSNGQAPDDSPDGLLAADNGQGGMAIAVIHLGLNLLAFDSGQGRTSIAALDLGLDALAANSGQDGMPLAALSLTLNAIAVNSELDNNSLEQSFQSILPELSQGGISDATIRLPDNHAMTLTRSYAGEWVTTV